MRFAEELDGVNPRQQRLGIVMVHRLELVEILERVKFVELGIGVTRRIGDVSGVDVHPPKGFEKRLKRERAPASNRRIHPAAANVKGFPFDT